MATELRAPDLAAIEGARRTLAQVIRTTPVVTSRTLSEQVGMEVALKAENLQRTGSFKLRGALNKIAALGGEEVTHGVLCGSAGNHAQGVAYAARDRGVPCEVFMPEGAPIGKVEAVRQLGATVSLQGATVDESLAAAQARAAATGARFIHPFEDPLIIAGQGTIGLELTEQVPNLGQVVVPIGGGGLISGIALAIKSLRPEVRIVGVQAAACAPVRASLELGSPQAVSSARSIADGIAVKRPGELTLELINKLIDEVVVVSEDQIAEAMVFLMARSKLVVEGAGAVGVAALLSGQIKAPDDPGATSVAVLSGGNVDAGLLAEVARRHETQAGRRMVLGVRIPDLPGHLAALLRLIGDSGANLLDVQHFREGFDLHVEETAVQLVLETRGPAHTQMVRQSLTDSGYSLLEPTL